MRDDDERLRDIEEAIADIERYAASGRSAFDANELIQAWMLFQLMIIGEAVRALSEEFRSHHPEVEWAQIVALRNNVVHRYFGIDPNIIWRIIEHDVPNLKRSVVAMLDSTDDAADPA